MFAYVCNIQVIQIWKTLYILLLYMFIQCLLIHLKNSNMWEESRHKSITVSYPQTFDLVFRVIYTVNINLCAQI